MDLPRCGMPLSALLELVMICVASTFIRPMGLIEPCSCRSLTRRPGLERSVARTLTPAQTDGGLARLEASP